MAPKLEFLLEQATACRQLALISDAKAAAKLHSLANEYEAEAMIDTRLIETTLDKHDTAD